MHVLVVSCPARADSFTVALAAAVSDGARTAFLDKVRRRARSF